LKQKALSLKGEGAFLVVRLQQGKKAPGAVALNAAPLRELWFCFVYS